MLGFKYCTWRDSPFTSSIYARKRENAIFYKFEAFLNDLDLSVGFPCPQTPLPPFYTRVKESLRVKVLEMEDHVCSRFCHLSWGSLCPGQTQLTLGLHILLCVWAPSLDHPWCLPRTICSGLPLGFWPAFWIQRTLLLATSQPGESNLEKLFLAWLQEYFDALGIQDLWKQNAWILLEYDLVQPLKK